MMKKIRDKNVDGVRSHNSLGLFGIIACVRGFDAFCSAAHESIYDIETNLILRIIWRLSEADLA